MQTERVNKNVQKGETSGAGRTGAVKGRRQSQAGPKVGGENGPDIGSSETVKEESEVYAAKALGSF